MLFAFHKNKKISRDNKIWFESNRCKVTVVIC